VRRRRAAGDLLVDMPPHLATLDLDLWCADGSTVAEAQVRWQLEVDEWATEAGVDGMVLLERLGQVAGTLGYPAPR